MNVDRTNCTVVAHPDQVSVKDVIRYNRSNEYIGEPKCIVVAPTPETCEALKALAKKEIRAPHETGYCQVEVNVFGDREGVLSSARNISFSGHSYPGSDEFAYTELDTEQVGANASAANYLTRSAEWLAHYVHGCGVPPDAGFTVQACNGGASTYVNDFSYKSVHDAMQSRGAVRPLGQELANHLGSLYGTTVPVKAYVGIVTFHPKLVQTPEASYLRCNDASGNEVHGSLYQGAVYFRKGLAPKVAAGPDEQSAAESAAEQQRQRASKFAAADQALRDRVAAMNELAKRLA